MSGDAPRKRARLEDEGADDNDEELRSVEDAEFWFDDGNIILEAKDTLFKIYRGPLVQHSQVFKDMLSFPQPQPAEAVCNDAPHTVRLTDSPEDLRHFLRALVPSKWIR